MSYYEKISCRVAIQVCIGYFPDGRERHRTFSMKGIAPDASFEAIAAVVRALAPLLAYPITKVRKVTKREIFFCEPEVSRGEESVMPVLENVAEPPPYAEARRIIPFTSREAAAEPPLRQMGFIWGRSPPFEGHANAAVKLMGI